MLTVAFYWKSVLESLTIYPALFFYLVQYGYSHDFIFYSFADIIGLFHPTNEHKIIQPNIY